MDLREEIGLVIEDIWRDAQGRVTKDIRHWKQIRRDQILYLIRQHIPEDKVKAVKEMLTQLVTLTLIDLSSSQPHGMVEEINGKTTRICRLFPKIKLPENPYDAPAPSEVVSLGNEHEIRNQVNRDTLMVRSGFNEALQQVKELNPDMEVE